MVLRALIRPNADTAFYSIERKQHIHLMHRENF